MEKSKFFQKLCLCVVFTALLNSCDANLWSGVMQQMTSSVGSGYGTSLTNNGNSSAYTTSSTSVSSSSLSTVSSSTSSTSTRSPSTTTTKKKRKCARCNGSGIHSTCKGTGKTTALYPKNCVVVCKDCHGTGKCQSCGGTGYYQY